MDVVSIPKLKAYYRVTYDSKGRLSIKPIKKPEADQKLVRIIRKIKTNKGFHITTHDGRSIMVNKTTGRGYATGSSLLIKVPSQEVVDYIKLVDNSLAFIIGGKHKGFKAKVKELRKYKAVREDAVIIKIGDNEFETIKSYVFPIGVKKEALTI